MATEQAARASSLVSFLGVNTHIDFQAYGYQDLSTTEQAIDYLGVKIIRDDPENPADVGPNGWWQQVAGATGAKFDAFLAEGSPAAVVSDLGLAQQLAGQGILSAIEGPNEEDDPYATQNGNNLSIAAAYMPIVYAAAQALGLPTINMSFGQGWTAANNWEGDYGSVGSLAGDTTYANAHTYPNGAPLSQIQLLNTDAELAAPGQPVITTEFGYDTGQFDLTTIAKYDLDAVFDSLQQGDGGLYFYALYDDGSGNWGLMNSDGSARPAGTAIHDLTTLLQDAGGGAGSFAPGALNYTLSGTQSGDNTYLFEKSDGTYWLGIWNEQQGLGASHNVTLSLGSAASQIIEYDPLTGTSAVETVSNASSATITVPDHPVLVEIVPGGTTGAADPPASTGTSGSTSGSDPSTPPTTASSGSDPTTTTTSSSSGSDPSTTGPNDLAVAVPASETIAAGGSIAVSGVAITDPWAAGSGGTMALNVYDNTGTISMAGQTYGPGGNKVPGGMVQGTLAQLNADLATLGYTAGATAGTDTLTVDVWNQAGVEQTEAININVGSASTPGGTGSSAPSSGATSGGTSSSSTSSTSSTPASGNPASGSQTNTTGTGPTDLSVAVPVSETIAAGGSIAVSGVAITDPWAAGTGGTMALNVYDNTGTISIGGQTYGPGGSKVPGGMVQGTLAQLNADLATLGYTAGTTAGTDTLTVDVWNQAGVEQTETIAIGVGGASSSAGSSSDPTPTTSAASTGAASSGATGSGDNGAVGTGNSGSGSTVANVVVPASQPFYAAMVSNQTISGSGPQQTIFLGGTGDTLTTTGGSDTVQAFQGGNVVTASGGGNSIYFGGSGNVINAGTANNTLYDSGANSTIVLNPGGNDTIYGYVMNNGDTFDLSGLLKATQWNGSLATLGNYLNIAASGNSAVLSIDPTGTAGGSSSQVATVEGSGPISLAGLLAHSIT